jgi:hypothetical protein
MRLSTVLYALVASSATALNIQPRNPNLEIESKLIDKAATSFEAAHRLVSRDEAEWKRAIARGEKLLKGMKGDDKEAAALYRMGGATMETVQSPWDGECVEDFKEWGYNDNTESMQKEVDKFCHFENFMSLEPAFRDLGKCRSSA